MLYTKVFTFLHFVNKKKIFYREYLKLKQFDNQSPIKEIILNLAKHF